MWKKEEGQAPAPHPRTEEAPRPQRAAVANASVSERATIGRSITIKGEVSGDEDLLIQGRVDGSVDLKQHSVTVGPEGEVKADITGRVVTVEGKVEGNLTADEQVILRSSASVQGDIAAPRVVLEDGASFRGGVDMGEVAERGRRTAAAPPAQGRRPAGVAAVSPEAGRTSPEGVEAPAGTAKSATDTGPDVTR